MKNSNDHLYLSKIKKFCYENFEKEIIFLFDYIITK